MIRKVNENFSVGGFVDGDSADRQEDAKIFAVLKCTDQPLADGVRERKFDFHSEYLNLEFANNGDCPVDGPVTAWDMVKDWLKNVEVLAKANGKVVLIQSWTGMGKAVRILAAHLSGWSKENYSIELAGVLKAAKIEMDHLRPLPEFEAALKKVLTENVKKKTSKVIDQAGPGTVTKKPKVKQKAKTKRPQLD